MPKVKLKPCPFCGSEDIYETYSQEIPFGTKNPEIFCNTCKAILAVEDDSPYLNCDEDFKYRLEKTAEAWNKRAELPSAEPKIVRCNDCNNASKCYGDVVMRSRGGGNIYCPLEFCSAAERRTDE